MRKWGFVILAVALVSGVGGIWFTSRRTAPQGRAAQAYETATVSRGSIESVVSASGTLSAVSTVSILAQMSGRVEKVNADYNDRVTKGQVLVELNTDMLKLEEKQAQAAVRKAQANYDLQLLDVKNKSSLAAKALIADYDLESSKTTLEVYAAELASAKSALEVIQTKLNQYAVITSPIDGIVLARNVDVGQSVVEGSSANASSLFTLARDLSRMEIKAEVDELDISSIRQGQEVRFTVEADPELEFSGKVREIRLVPKTEDNVVSYYVMIDADNKAGKLLPGMTAEVQFIKEKKTNVLVVPSAALRFTPPEAARSAAKSSTKTQAKGLAGMLMPMGPPGKRSAEGNATAAAAEGNEKTLWYVDDSGKPSMRPVKAGATNGTNTEIIGADDLEGRKVIVRITTE